MKTWNSGRYHYKIQQIFFSKFSSQAKVINIVKGLYVPEKMGIIIPFMVKMQMIRGFGKFFCGAGHEMAAIDVDGTRCPCHRFMPWITNKPAPKENVNCQTAWKPKSCANCK